jgi:hypothetical protein
LRLTGPPGIAAAAALVGAAQLARAIEKRPGPRPSIFLQVRHMTPSQVHLPVSEAASLSLSLSEWPGSLTESAKPYY